MFKPIDLVYGSGASVLGLMAYKLLNPATASATSTATASAATGTPAPATGATTGTPDVPSLGYMVIPGVAFAATGGSMLGRGDMRGLGYVVLGVGLSALETVGKTLFGTNYIPNVKPDLTSILTVTSAAVLGAAGSAYMAYNSRDKRIARDEAGGLLDARELNLQTTAVENEARTYSRRNTSFGTLGATDDDRKIDPDKLRIRVQKSNSGLLDRLDRILED